MTAIPSTLRTSQSKPQSASKSQPWHSYLTLDLIITVLSRTLFQPFIACLLPLCLRALAAPYNSTSFIVTFAFAFLVCIYHVWMIIDTRIAYGSPRLMDWEKEIVVITGGAQGLGACMAEIYSLRSVAVAVIDIAVPQEQDGTEVEGIWYYRCDIKHYGNVEETWERIVKDVGTPTILINGAAFVKASRLTETHFEDAHNVFRVNTLAHFQLAQCFLKRLLKRKVGGTIVTVASVLGQLGAANLTAYAASKGALLAYHASLSAELAITAPQIKTILVAPGQLDTPLFGEVQMQGWLQNLVGPVVGAGELAVKIVEMVDKGQGGEVRIPAYARWIIPWMGVMSPGLQMMLRQWSGVDNVMSHVGRQEMEKKDNAQDSEEANSETSNSGDDSMGDANSEPSSA